MLARSRLASRALRTFRPRLSACRLGSSKSEQQDPTPLPALVDASLRGAGQVVFCNSPTSGAVILGSLAYGDPFLGAMAALGTASSTVTARACRLDDQLVSSGLAGYNGMLVGCAFSAFLGAPPATCALSTVLGAAASVPVVLALKPACGSVPQWTLAFNAVTLARLAAVQPLAGAPPADPAAAIGAAELACAPLVGVSQIFVVGDPLVGAALLGAIGYYSPGAAAHTLMGSIVGTGVGLAVGAPAAEIGAGLWGFNSALTSLAVSIFYVAGPPSYALAAGGAATTAVLFGGAKAVLGDAFGVPALTLPFCAVASCCYLAHRAVPALALAKAPHSPEKNEP